ncbi:hypothetical protein BDZ45DRAFT_751691 [Acephala macrosclerotiorum]|nr:hypothetical protein BDZ45DRAFT_751691 [Acephala macrosclerotiorum]
MGIFKLCVETIARFNDIVTQTTLFDLYAQDYSRTNTFNQLIISNVTLRNASSVRWNVSVPDDELAVQQSYILKFITTPGDHSGSFRILESRIPYPRIDFNYHNLADMLTHKHTDFIKHTVRHLINNTRFERTEHRRKNRNGNRCLYCCFIIG